MKPRRFRTGLFLVAAAVLLAAALMVAAPSLFQRANVAERLPALPNLSGAPAELATRLNDARARAANPATAVSGLEEFGALCHANGFLAEAERCWDLLHALQPREARWIYRLADLRRLAGDDAMMAAWLQQTVRLAPNYAPAWLRLAEWEFKRGALADAARDYRKRLELAPADPYARLGLARVALQGEDRVTARRELERLIRDVPEFSSAHNLYAELLEAEGDAARAKRERLRGTAAGRFREADDAWLDDMIDRCYDYDQLCFRGTKEVLFNRRDRAQALFQRAIELKPRRVEAYDLLGALYADANEFQRARETYEHALAIATDTAAPVKTYVSLSRMYRLTDQPAAAVRVLQQAALRIGSRPDFDEALGLAWSQLGETDDAIAALSRAVAATPANATWQYELAIELLNAGRKEQGIDALRRSLAAEPTFPAALGLLAQLEIEAAHWQSAIEYLAPLYESNPEAPGAREKMAYGYLCAGDEARDAGNAAAAERFYRSGLAIDGDHAELQSHLADLLRDVARPR